MLFNKYWVKGMHIYSHTKMKSCKSIIINRSELLDCVSISILHTNCQQVSVCGLFTLEK